MAESWKNLIGRVANALKTYKIQKPFNSGTQIDKDHGKKTRRKFTDDRLSGDCSVKSKSRVIFQYFSGDQVRDLITPVTVTVTEIVGKGCEIRRRVDDTVKTKYSVLYEWYFDDQFRDFLSRNLKFIAQYSALFAIRSYGGGPIIDFVSASLQHQDAASQKDKLRELEIKVAKLEKALCSRKTRLEVDIYMACSNSRDKPGFRRYVKPNPEDILRLFLMRHLGLKVAGDFSEAHSGSVKNMRSVPLLDQK